MFVVDAPPTPMQIMAEYDKDNVHANGCGGIQADDTMYINSGAGALATNPDRARRLRLRRRRLRAARRTPPNMPAPELVYTYDGRTASTPTAWR